MTDLRHYIDLVKQSDAPVAESVKKKAGDKVMQNIVGQTAAQRLAAELPSTARINGVTWEKVGNNYFNRKADKVISTDEFVALQRKASSGANTASAGANSAAAATTSAATTAASTVAKPLLKRIGSVVKQAIKNNPKIATALGIVGGLTTYNVMKDPAADTPAADTPAADTPANQNTPPNQTPPANQSGQPDDELASIKAEIDALVKELEASNSEDIKKQLEKLKQTLNGRPARWSDDPSIIE